MIRSFLISFIILLSQQIYAQDLEGEWKGEYRRSPQYFPTLTDSDPITIKFIPTTDSLFDVFSFITMRNNFNRDTTVVTKLEYSIQSKQMLTLKETHLVQPSEFDSDCLMEMSLVIKKTKKGLQMNGYWIIDNKTCPLIQGTIQLTKIK